MSQEQIQDLKYKISELKSDPLLKDLPKTFTLEELDTLIALEQGRAYHIVIDRSPLASISLVVSQSSTIREIKKLFRKQLERKEAQERGTISWKYIWRTYCFMLGEKKLMNDEAVVSQLGIKQNTVLRFARIPHEKGHHRKAWHWYKR